MDDWEGEGEKRLMNWTGDQKQKLIFAGKNLDNNQSQSIELAGSLSGHSEHKQAATFSSHSGTCQISVYSNFC